MFKSRNGFDTYSKGDYKGNEHFIETYAGIDINKAVKLTVGADFRASNSNQLYSSLGFFGPFKTALGKDSLKQNQKIKVDTYFKNMIFPVLTPITFSNYLPFPLLPNLSVYLIVRLTNSLVQTQYSIVTVPSNIERVVKLKKELLNLLLKKRKKKK